MDLKTLFICGIGDEICITHDGYMQLGVFGHTPEKHIELSNAICGDDPIDWQITYWCPDIFTRRYPRCTYQNHLTVTNGKDCIERKTNEST